MTQETAFVLLGISVVLGAVGLVLMVTAEDAPRWLVALAGFAIGIMWTAMTMGLSG